MRTKGHLGFGLLLSSLVLLIWPYSATDTSLWLWIVFFLGGTKIPDIDIIWGVEHRGFTHTLAGALLFGFLFALPFYGNPYDALTVFAGVSGGILSHVIGDMMTFKPLKPLWPLSSREVALGLFESSNETVNSAFAKLGTTAFTLVLLQRLGFFEALFGLTRSLP